MSRTTIEENGLLFAFEEEGARYAVKFDDTPEYRRIRVPHTKGVDIAGLTAEGEAFFIEIKDFKTPSSEDERFEQAETRDKFVNELAQKVVGTLAAYVGGARQPQGSPALWQETLMALADGERSLYYVVWLEYVESEDWDEAERERKTHRLTVIEQKLKKKLRWLTNQVYVFNSRTERYRRDFPYLEVRRKR